MTPLEVQCKTCRYNFKSLKDSKEWCYMFYRKPEVRACLAYRKDRYAEEPQSPPAKDPHG